MPECRYSDPIRDYVSEANIIVGPAQKNLYRDTAALLHAPSGRARRERGLLVVWRSTKGGAYLLDCIEAASA